jgi:beta-N-acetylhexosaminidase
MIRGRSLWRIFIALTLIMVRLNIGPVRAETPSRAEILLQAMSAEEKIGQLFLVTFEGTDIGRESEIYNLITQHHIGGVVLRRDNNNFSSEETVTQTRGVTEGLQLIEWAASQRSMIIGDTGTPKTPEYVPLFIGIKQIGNGFPGDQILTGLTQLPSQMAIGATWDVNLAYQVGEVLGTELSTLGFNLFLGPNLDVLDMVESEAAGYLGVNTYGGNPFWVGEMGKSVISGLHDGSHNRVLVVAQNFPGTGNADRSPAYEVATVRKSLEQLKRIELAPYFTVTTPTIGDPGRVDAVMLSHVRYQAFQGNIRASTNPISLDSNALQQLMTLSQFANWRESGGLIISDNLGSGALRRFIETNGTSFQARQVARNAFLAGNDILYVDDFIASGDPDAYTTLVSTLDFFIQKYQEDSAFARRVDSSVRRILEAKLDLYGDFAVENILASQNDVEGFGQSQEINFAVAQNAVTLISPSAQELDSVLSSPPLLQDNMVIFTDVRQISQCDGCDPTTSVNTNALASILVNLYGPQAGGLIHQHRLTSYTFSQLVDLLENVESEQVEDLDQSLRAAEWVVFNTLNVDPQYPASDALQRVLDERPDLLSDKNVIVFAMDAPFYLDSTNISKITAYYALYSKTPEFLDVAARVLMQELVPSGALPISLSAIGYDLVSMTSPNPSQVIGLQLVLPEVEETDSQEETTDETPDVTQTPEPTALPKFNVGDTITIRTSQIYDHNQNVVPDGTTVRFNFRISGEPSITQQFDTVTAGGVAFFNYRIEAAGALDITATSAPATQSETLQINISTDGIASVFSFTPTPMVSPTPTETPTSTPTEVPAPTSIPEVSRNRFPTLGEWALGVMVIGLGGGLTFLVGYFWWGSSRWGLRSSLCTLIGGLLSYLYLNLGMEGTAYWLIQSGTSFVVEIVVVGLLLGWIGALIWWMWTEGRYPVRGR